MASPVPAREHVPCRLTVIDVNFADGGGPGIEDGGATYSTGGSVAGGPV